MRSKSKIQHNRNNRRRQHLRRVLLASILGTTGSVAQAQMPTGADVVAGQAAISQAGNTLNVNASTSRAIVNWDSFSVGAGNVANFNLPDASSAILNRVTSANMPSTIAGMVNSNGHVYLVNPSGIVVSSSGMVNTNGFTASTFDIANHDFMAGDTLSFVENGSKTSIVNDGSIVTGDGGAHLIANQITNNGTISSIGGNITLSGGGSVTLDNGVTYVQPTMETLVSGISPTAGLIQNTGTIRATGAATSGGEVYLVNPNGRILHDGTIDSRLALGESNATGDATFAEGKATIGGHVQLEADDITLTANSKIDARGRHGGGEVLVGGDWQGSGEMSQATSVTMEAGATIDASATESGDGGTIVLWSDVANVDSITKALGTLIARAGELLGDGGQIETSGATVETDGIVVNAGAANGKGGLWLIDPYDYTINASAATNIVNTLNTGTSVEVATTANNTSFGSSGNSGGQGDITVASDIVTGAMSGDATLTLKAARHIVVNAGTGIDATQNGNTAKLNVKLWADIDNSGDGINIVSSPTIATNGGSLTFGNGDTATIGGVTTQVGGDLYVNGVTAQLFDTNGGDITVNGETILANTNGVTFDSGGGNIVFGGVLNSGNQYTYIDGPDGQQSWGWARNDAKNGTAGGTALGDSYLVTITSRLENAVAGIAAGYRGAWLGMYRDTSTPRDWVWADGPEAGQHFFTEIDAGGGTAEPGWYSNFGPGEPNGGPDASGENVGQFFGNQGQWNDLGAGTTFSGTQDSAYAVLGYVRETNLTPTALTVDAGTGSVTINGGVGGSKALSSFGVTASAITINGNSLITTGAQTFNTGLNVTSSGNLTVGGTSLAISGASEHLLLKATGNIIVNTDTQVVTNGGDITLWSDSDNSGQGYIFLKEDAKLDSRTLADRTATTHTTGGGAITLAGGADNGSGAPGGYAIATSGDTDRGGINFGDQTVGGHTNSTQIYSGGGDVVVRGKSTHGMMGFNWVDGGTIHSGDTGTITIEGVNTNNGHAIEIGSWNNGGVANLLSGAGAGAISITGNASAGTGQGIQSSNLVAQATGTNGSISLNGSSVGGRGILAAMDLLASSGPITLGGGSTGISLSAGTLGRKAGTSVTASTADITLTGDDVNFFGATNVHTTGTVTVEPSGTSFSSALSWPLNNLNLSSDIGGLTLGKSGNTTAITLGNDISIAGPLTFYAPIIVSSDRVLTATNSNINFNGTVNSDGTARSLTVNAGTADAIFNGVVGSSSALNNLIVNSTATVAADVTANGNQTWADALTVTGASVLNASSLSLQEVTAGANDLTFATNSLTMNENVNGTGNLTIRTKTSGNSIGVGTATGSLTINNSDLARLQDGFASITIGSTSSGALSVGGLVTLTDDLTLRAGSGRDLNVTGPISWSTDHALTLAAGDDINVLDNISVNGSAATLNLFYGGTNGTTTPDAGDNFYLNVADAKTIQFANTSSSLKIGNQGFTLLDSIAGFQGMSTNGNYALAGDLSLAGNTYTDAFYSGTFTGKLDGLGNEVNGLTIRANAGGNYGLFGQLSGATMRHLGVTNIDLLGQSTSNAAANDLRSGGLAGNVSGSGTTLLDGVWSTGVIATKQGSQQDVFYAGGIAGGHDSGTLHIVRSFSTVNVSSQGSHSGKMALGGLLGDSGNYNGTSSIGGWAQNVLIDRSYAIGSIVEGTYDGYYGSGGLIGVIYGNTATLTDSFSRSNVVGGISSGGIAGYSLPETVKTYQRLYTTLDRFGNGTNPTQSYTSNTLDAATNNGTQLPPGWSSEIWTAGEFPTLKSVGVPASLLYVQVLGGTGIFGDLAAPTYQIVDANGNVVTFGTGKYSNLDGVTGTGRYTLGQFTNVGTYNSVSYLSGLGLTGDDANLFALNPFTTAGSYTITARSITAVLSATGVNKVYDGNVNAGLGYSPTWSFTNIVSGDSATLNIGSSFFNDANVLDANLFTINGLSLAGITSSNGALISDYVLANTTASVAANITTKPIIINGLFANDKIYDGNATGSINSSGVTYSGLISGDSVGLSGLAGTFADKNVGTDKVVTVTGSFTGTDSANYSATLPTTLTADISPKTVVVSGITAHSRVYDGTTSTTVDLSGVGFAGIISGDNLSASGTTGTFADKNVGNGKTVTLSGTTYGGTDAGNYSFTNQTTTTADITPKSLTVSGLVANNLVYDGTTNATVDHSGVTFTGMIAGDNLTASATTGQFADKNVADDKAVTLSGTTYAGTDVNNYTFTDQTSSTADITPKSITVSGITAADKVYDGTTTSTVDLSGVTFNGIIAGDTLAAADTTGIFDNKNVGSSKTVMLSGTTYSGADVNNYAITDQASTTADVTPKSVTVSGLVVNDRIYDGTTDATVDHSGVTFGGMIAGDNLTAASTTGQFADKHVADNKAVTLSGTTYGGTDVGNYSFTGQVASNADITPKSISVSGLLANDRIYDTTTHATVDHSGVIFSGIVVGDDLTASGTTGLFADKHVGTTKAVTLSGTTYGGTDVGNYVIADQTVSTADITPFSLVITGVTADNKVYDSTTTATLSGTATVNSFAGDDVVIDTNYIASFAGANVGDDLAVNVSGFALTGTDAANYSLAQPSGLTADITPAPLTITANHDSKFVTKTDAIGYAGATFNGFVGSEGVSDLAGSLTITRLGTDEAAGTFSSVLDASGLTSTNYDITFVRGDYTIIPAEQFLIRFGNSDSTYGDAVEFSFLSAEYMDAGFNVATLTPTIVGSDYSFSDGVGGTAQFTIGLDGATLSTSGHANAGTYNLTMGDLIASGGNFSNDINLFGTHTVNRANLTVGTGGVSKTYDGNDLMNNLTLNITGLFARDAVNINGQGSYADRHAGTGISYTVGNLALSGADANNYVLPGGSVLTDTNGIITPKAVTIDAPSVSKVYDGNTTFVATATQLNDWTTALGITGDTVDGITLTFADKNVGTGKTLTPSSILINDGNGGANYNITLTNNTNSVITRLNSVTWIGGATGDWNDPANWAGGAVPDLANVANVIIPFGVTPTFGTNVAGPVELESFSGGSLQIDGGTLDVFGLFDADTLTQNGGMLEAGDLNVTDFAQNGGNVQVDNDFTVTNTFAQSISGTIGVGRLADIMHTGGTLTVNNLTGGNVKLDSTNGGVHLNNLQSAGTLAIDATGDITQDPTGTLTVAGATTITTDADINLGGPNNDFVGPVNLDATNVTIQDSNGGLVLGNITTTGSLDVQTIAGDITQTTASQIRVGTTTTLVADGDIELTGTGNQFTGPVNLDANNAEITQATGDLVLGTLNIVDQFWTDVLSGKLKQTPTGTITVGGKSTLNARGPIELDGTGNDFQGSVTVNAPLFNVRSVTPPMIIRTGASLANDVGLRANAAGVRDTIIRPAQGYQDDRGYVARVVQFFQDLLGKPGVDATNEALPSLDIEQDGNDTFIRPKR